MEDKITLLKIEDIDPPIDAARDFIDPDSVRELADSIREQGLLQPILVRPSNGRYEVVVGHRRFLAHRILGEVKIKSIIKKLSDDETFFIRAIENDQREDLNPIEKAKIYKKLNVKFGLSISQIAKKLSRSRVTIERYLKLLEIPEEFQEAVAKKKLVIQVATRLLDIEDPEFQKYYFRAAVENGATQEVAEFWVNEWRKTRANERTLEAGGGGIQMTTGEDRPIYQTCYTCFGAVSIKDVRYVPICPNCDKEIKKVRAEEEK